MEGRSKLYPMLLHSYARLPRWARLMVVRLLAPSHTVGALCFIEHEDRVLLLRQHHRPGWTLPGGLINRGETAAQAVVREVREETGLDVEVGVPLNTVVDPRGRRVDVIFHVPVTAEPAVAPRSEAVHAAWLALDQAGDVDEPTAQAFAAFTTARRTGAGRGRLRGPDEP